MISDNPVVLYHGTDWESALDILNHGLNIENLRALQIGRMTQLGEGWYTTDNVDIAWYFASIAPGAIENSYTVIEMIIHLEHLESLFEQRRVIKHQIVNVLFQGEQYWFHPDAFRFLNQHEFFQPYSGEE